MPKRTKPHAKSQKSADRVEHELRIIAGKYRRSILKYAPEQTRPMKHRTREALFSLLGDEVKYRWAIDLFAGAGALGLESLSRGAKRATFIERFVPALKIISENIALLNLGEQSQVVLGDAFRWARDLPASDPPESRLVFYCPPYRFYDERTDDMRNLVARMIETDAGDGVHVVEANADFNFGELPHAEHWDIRTFAPAQIGFLFLSRLQKETSQ